MEPHAGTVLWIAGALAGILVILGSYVYTNTQDRIKELRDMSNLKADQTEMNRQRDNVSRIFEMFRTHEAEDRSRHEQLLNRINDGQREIIEAIRQAKNR